MSYSERIHTKLTDTFAPERLDVIDESEQHRGHGGYREGGETHFKVIMVSSEMNGKSRVEMQRAIYKVLKEELDERVHALALEISGTD